MDWVKALALAYFLGSIPFGLILARLSGAGDLRAIGSGNIGATNVLRTGRKGVAAATLLLDMAKGLAAVLLARAMWPGTEAVAAVGAVLGHCFPLWLRFRGGKGVATTMGVALGLAWPIGLAYAVVWLGMLGLTRISSLGGLSAAAAAPVVAGLIGQRDYAVALVVIAIVVFTLHHENIDRLKAGTEPRVGRKG